VSIRATCFCLSSRSWFCSAAYSFLIICSLSRMASSLTPSSISRSRSFSVETATLSTGAISSLLDMRGNISFTACKASIHATRSSGVSALKWSVLVPVKTENLLSSDLLSRIVETYTQKAELNITNTTHHSTPRKRKRKSPRHPPHWSFYTLIINVLKSAKGLQSLWQQNSSHICPQSREYHR